MEYLSVSDISRKWHVSERSVRNYCAQGRIAGAFLTGKTWTIPETAQKPTRLNGRKRRESPLLARLREEKAARTRGGIYHRIQVELTYNSNRIEGNRLSLDQTRLIFETNTLLSEGESIRVDDIVETANHFRAIDYIIDIADQPLNDAMLKEMHRILKTATGDASAEWFNVGGYKRLPNEVAGSNTTPPDQVAHAIDDLLQRYGKASRHTFEEIIEFHVAFERIHPFQDGNGRVGRLAMFKECLANGVTPFIIDDDIKSFYYRGLSEWNNERGFLLDTCLAAQDRFKALLEYFEIPCS